MSGNSRKGKGTLVSSKPLKLFYYIPALTDLEIISLPDLQPAFLKRTDLSLAAQAGNGSAGGPGSATIKIENEKEEGRTEEETDPYKDEIVL